MGSLATTCGLLTLVVAHGVALAEPCAPAAVVSGDPSLAARARELLIGHGIATDEAPGCPAVHVSLSQRGDVIVLSEESSDGASHEHVVSELDTAATVIESWTRSDLDTSVFATHTALPPAPPAAVVKQQAAPPPLLHQTSVQAFGAFEASFADDRTGWLGVMVGACVQIGTLCASARARFSTVVQGPEQWADRERHAVDLLLGADLPRHLGATTLLFGFGAGIGATHTGIEESAGMRGSQTFGLRADAHVTWLVPLGHHLALDLGASIDLAQVTDVEMSSSTPLADEPRVLGRLGAGLHIGAK